VRWLVLILPLLAASLTAKAFAQSVGDVVREHVEDELENKPKHDGHDHHADKDRDKENDKDHKPKHTRRPAADSGKNDTPRPAPVAEPEPEPEPEPQGPPLPQRIFGDNWRFDIQVGAGYRGWFPQQYPLVDVRAGSYYIWNIDVKAKLFKFLSLRRGYYESNGLSGPRTEEAAVAAQVGSYVPKAAWLLGVIGFPLFKVWEPTIRYETRAFHTESDPKRPVCIVTKEVANDLSECDRSRDPLRMTSSFETLVIGVRYDKSKDPSAVLAQRDARFPPITFGVGLMQYRKPYQVTINKNTLDDLLFDGRFRGAGLAGGIEIAGGPDKFHVNADVQVGLGEVKLLQGLTLNSLAPEDWLIGYVQGNVTLGYHWPIWRAAPTLMLVPEITAGGASFFFFKPVQKEGEDADAATANWDFLWSVNASLVLSL
jgi:hypothetical protein